MRPTVEPKKLYDWSYLEKLVKLESPRTLQELKNRFQEQVDECSDEDKAAYLEDLIRDSIFHELERLRKSRRNANPGDAKYWQGLNKRLLKADLDDLKKISWDIVGRFGREIHGRFDPWAYATATQILPGGLTVLLHTATPGILAKKIREFSRLAMQPSFDRVMEMWDGLPSLKDHVIVQGEVETLQSLVNKGTVILVPTHVSNMDSPLVGWAIFDMELPPFTYGAGLNLFSNPIIGWFMHHLGAYTVDRTKQAKLYKMTLKNYSTFVLERGQHSLFFPGGTRSRSGEVETHLKLGLLATGLQAFIANVRRKKENPNIYIVPATISYQVVLEAETLIDDHLKSVKESRHIITDDEFSKLPKWMQFAANIVRLNSKIVFTVSKPLDPFGNPVSLEGKSLDPMGREIDLSCYVMRNNYLVPDPQRDAEYTRRLGEKIVEAFHRDNVIVSTNAACLAIFHEMEEAFGKPLKDPFPLLRYQWQETPLQVSKVVETLDRLQILLKEGAAKGRFRLGAAFGELTPRQLLNLAAKNLAGYHTRPPIRIEGPSLIPEDPEVILYYSNRARGYELERQLKA